ncbi:uncharacterized protein LOC111192137 [Astyanax mexicanus]|uniref:uncharacterized protein LOC111192137 n=1 Tax=Astyanax mexicanus TaxID=7994 RepID=UPI0020CAF98D|nr:uncharacterized protein LOC111192137 [Astyanax mexicanus]
MSMTVCNSKAVNMFTLTPNPKSIYPLLCQLLCCRSFYSVFGSLKQHMASFQTVLGTLQIMVGLVNVGYGVFILYLGSMIWSTCIWLGAVFFASGILCVIADKFPSPCMVNLAVLGNVLSFGLSINAIVVYSTDLAQLPRAFSCALPGDSYGYRYRYYGTTLIPTTIDDRVANCERYKHMLDFSLGGLDVMMILLGGIQLCLTFSSCLLCLKALCMKMKEEQTEDPELYKPLMKKALPSPVC